MLANVENTQRALGETQLPSAVLSAVDAPDGAAAASRETPDAIARDI